MSKERIEYTVLNLDDSNQELFCHCLEDWSDEIKEAGDHKKEFCKAMTQKGLHAKLARMPNGKIGGMIQYIPAEYSQADGADTFFIYCTWVHGYKKGIGNVQKKGMGSTLLKAAEEDITARGAAGIAAWGVSLPFWMKSSFYKKHGYKTVEKDGIMELVWKPLKEGAVPPKWRKPLKRPEISETKLIVTSFVNGICPAMNMAAERAARAVKDLGGPIEHRIIRTRKPESLQEWGISDALYIGSREVPLGPPPSYKKIRKLIQKEAKRFIRRS